MKKLKSLEETKDYVDGIDVMEDLIVRTELTREKSQISIDVMTEMLESIHKINYISDVIAGIISQINLLLLNASIEAARTG